VFSMLSTSSTPAASTSNLLIISNLRTKSVGKAKNNAICKPFIIRQMTLFKIFPEEPASGKESSFSRRTKAFIKSVSDMRRQTANRLAQLFKAPARARSIPARDGFEIGQARRRLGLTQEASVVHEGLRRGLIQHLFMDEDLADLLGEIGAVPSRSS